MINNTIPKTLQIWAKSISKRNPRVMTSLYCKEAILLPTYDTVLIGREKIEEYFIDFLNKEDLKCTIILNFTQNIGVSQVASGKYIFSFLDNGIKKQVFARYTYVIQNGVIINHHSSVVPN
jgi:hypothetical protein|tara:strand:+ start:236 stop:598 length:363 start_codon:yes stop_codon:yes gene_type:complete